MAARSATVVALLTAAALLAGSAGAQRDVADRAAAFIQPGAELVPTDEQPDGQFGFDVALSGDGRTALVGAPADAGGVGAAWVLTRTGSTWRQQGAKLTAGDESGIGAFGGHVALSADGSTALIGGASDGGVGAVWVFVRSGSTWS